MSLCSFVLALHLDPCPFFYLLLSLYVAGLAESMTPLPRRRRTLQPPTLLFLSSEPVVLLDLTPWPPHTHCLAVFSIVSMSLAPADSRCSTRSCCFCRPRPLRSRPHRTPGPTPSFPPAKGCISPRRFAPNRTPFNIWGTYPPRSGKMALTAHHDQRRWCRRRRIVA